MRFLTHWIVIAIAIWVCTLLLPGVKADSLWALALAALAVGLVNAVVRPLLVLLTLPVTCLTLGLFYLVVNGVTFALAAWLVPGFRVASFGWAIAGALVVSVVSTVLGWLVPDRRENS
jgi:putative membrane protein